MAIVDQKDLVGTMMPDVYVSKITLETGGTPFFQRDPHISGRALQDIEAPQWRDARKYQRNSVEMQRSLTVNDEYASALSSGDLSRLPLHWRSLMTDSYFSGPNEFRRQSLVEQSRLVIGNFSGTSGFSAQYMSKLDDMVREVHIEAKRRFETEAQLHYQAQADIQAEQNARLFNPSQFNEDGDNDLTVTLEYKIKEKLDNGSRGTWLFNQKFKKYTRIAIIKSEIPAATNILLAKVSLPGKKNAFSKRGLRFDDGGIRFGPELLALTDPDNDNLTITSGISLNDVADLGGLLPGYGEDWRAALRGTSRKDVRSTINSIPNASTGIDASGNEVTDITNEIKFEIRHADVQHLAFFAFTYLDVDTMIGEYGDLEYDPEDFTGNVSSPWTGKVTSDIVIQGGKVNKLADVLVDADTGVIWTGPYHIMSGGSSWSQMSRAEKVPYVKRAFNEMVGKPNSSGMPETRNIAMSTDLDSVIKMSFDKQHSPRTGPFVPGWEMPYHGYMRQLFATKIRDWIWGIFSNSPSYAQSDMSNEARLRNKNLEFLRQTYNRGIPHYMTAEEWFTNVQKVFDGIIEAVELRAKNHFENPATTSPTQVTAANNQRPETKYMTGAKHSATSRDLRKVKVPNSKVQDMRKLKENEKLELNLRRVNTPLFDPAVKTSQQGADKLDVVPKDLAEAALSEMYLSNDAEGNCRFYFCVDMLKIISEASAFGSLYTRGSKASSNLAVLNYLKIRSLKILRKQVTTGMMSNDLGGESHQRASLDEGYFRKPPKVVISSGDRPNSNQIIDILPGNEVSSWWARINSDIDPATARENNSITEITSLFQAGVYGRGIRHFTGTDADLNNITNGLYQYGVEIEFEDKTVELIKARRDKIHRLLHLTKEYYKQGTKLGMTGDDHLDGDPHISGEERLLRGLISEGPYDPVAGRFTTAFINMVEELDPIDNPWVKVPMLLAGTDRNESIYLSTIQLLRKDPQNWWDKPFDIKEVSGVIKDLVSPCTGSPRGVKMVISMLEKLLKAMNRMTNINSTMNKGSAIATPDSAVGNSRTRVRTMRMTKFFPMLFDGSSYRDLGYDYLSTGGEELFAEASRRHSRGSGLMRMPTGEYITRVNEETRKYFKQDRDISFATLNPSGKSFRGGNINDTKYMYLSPANIYLPDSTFRRGPSWGNWGLDNKAPVITFSRRLDNSFVHNKGPSPEEYSQFMADIKRLNNNRKRLSGVAVSLGRYNISEYSEKHGLTEPEQRLKRSLLDVFAEKGCTIYRKVQNRDPMVENVIFDTYGDIVGELQDGNIGLLGALRLLGGESDFSDSNVLEEAYRAAYNFDAVDPNNTLLALEAMEEKEMVSLSDYDISEQALGVGKTQGRLFDNAAYVFYCEKHRNKAQNIQSDKELRGYYITTLPNQTKALLASKDNSVPTIPVADPVHQPASIAEFNIKFRNLVRIEALTGYKKQPVTGHAIISAPIFEPLTDELINSGRSYMCRLVRYSNKSLNISLSEDMELPIYHQYFFLVGNNTSIAPSLATLADIDSISFDELTEERTTRESELECSPEYAGTVEET